MSYTDVWVCPAVDVSSGARPVTDDRSRGIRYYTWTYDGTHLVYVQDANGDENFHVFAVDPATRVSRDLTPFPGVQASIAGTSRVVRDKVLVSMNRRDRRYFDLYALHLATGELSMLAENTDGLAGFVAGAGVGAAAGGLMGSLTGAGIDKAEAQGLCGARRARRYPRVGAGQ